MGAGASTRSSANGGRAPRLGHNAIAPATTVTAVHGNYSEINLKILFIGLDGAGKTCILQRIMRKEVDEVRPTNGFSRHNIALKLKRQPLSEKEARDMTRRAQDMPYLSHHHNMPIFNHNRVGPAGHADNNGRSSVLGTPPPHDSNAAATVKPFHSEMSLSRSIRHSVTLPDLEGEALNVRVIQRHYSSSLENDEDNFYSRRRRRPGDGEESDGSAEHIEMFETIERQARTDRLPSHEGFTLSEAEQFADKIHHSRSMPIIMSVVGGGSNNGGPQLNNVDLGQHKHNSTHNLDRLGRGDVQIVGEPKDLVESREAPPEINENSNHTGVSVPTAPSAEVTSHQPTPLNPLPYANQLTKSQHLEVFDVGGNPNIRQIWDKYFAEVFGVVFVVDAVDINRVDEARYLLRTAFQDKRLAGKPFLLLFNKKDVYGSLRNSQLAEQLQLGALTETDPSFIRGSNYRVRIHVESSTVFPSHVRNARRRDILRRSVLQGLRWLVNHILHPDYFNALLDKVQHDSHAQNLHDQREQLEKMERFQRLRDALEPLEGAEANDQAAVAAIGEPFRPIQELVRDVNNKNNNNTNRRRSSTAASFHAMDLQHQRRQSSRTLAAERPAVVQQQELVVEQIVTETHTIPDGKTTKSTDAPANGFVEKMKRPPLYRRGKQKDIERIREIAMQHVPDDAVIE